MSTEDSLQSSKGHNPRSLDEGQQQADKPIANSLATAGVNNQDEDAADPETVRGSGFTYDENKDQTDKSLPIEQAESDQVVQLPELGKPNRP